MATRIQYDGNDTCRRYPRTLAEAFPRDHAIWHTLQPRRSVLDTVCWLLGLALLFCIPFAPTIWSFFHG